MAGLTPAEGSVQHSVEQVPYRSQAKATSNSTWHAECCVGARGSIAAPIRMGEPTGPQGLRKYGEQWSRVLLLSC